MITVYGFMDMFTERNAQRIELFNLATDSRIFRGEYGECPGKYDNLEICSIDTMFDFSDTLVLNVDVDPEDSLLKE